MTPVGRAFKFYLWQRSYKALTWKRHTMIVVICFQILSLTTFLQDYKTGFNVNYSCDLLSNFIFDNVLTSGWLSLSVWIVLWFAFKFYLWQRSYMLGIEYSRCYGVVICFQILSLTTFLQVLLKIAAELVSCDLLSNFIFDNVLTRVRLQ